MGHVKWVFVCCSILLVASSTFAAPTLTNGSFSSGLAGWSVEYGTVTDGGGYALFKEDAVSLSSTLSQSFTLPTGSQSLFFDIIMEATSGGSDAGFPADAFTASLLDAVTYAPLISNPGYSDYFYSANDGYTETVAGLAGNSVFLDVSAFSGRNVLLSFDLWGGDDGMMTSVRIDNIGISAVPAPSAIVLGGIGIGIASWLRRRKSI